MRPKTPNIKTRVLTSGAIDMGLAVLIEPLTSVCGAHSYSKSGRVQI